MNVEQPETVVERDWEGRERLACRDREALQSDIDRHVAARRAYEQALARVTAIERKLANGADRGSALESLRGVHRNDGGGPQRARGHADRSESARRPVAILLYLGEELPRVAARDRLWRSNG